MADDATRTGQDSAAVEHKKKEYASPKVVHSEKMTSRATACALADSATCDGGPIQS